MRGYVKIIKVSLIFLGVTLLLSSCANAPTFQTQLHKENLIQKLSNQITSQKDFTLPLIQSFKSSMQSNDFPEPTSSYIENNIAQIEAFYNNPDDSLHQIANEDQGVEKLELLEAVYDEADPDTISRKMDEVDSEMGQEYTQNVIQISAQSLSLPRSLNYGFLAQTSLQASSSGLPFNSMNVNMYSGVCMAALAGEIVCKYSKAPWLKLAGAATALASYLAMAYTLYLWQESFSAGLTNEVDENGNPIITGDLYPPNSNYVYQVVVSTALPLGYAVKVLPGEMVAIEAALNKWAAKVSGLPLVKFVQYGIIEIPLGKTVLDFTMTPDYIGFKIKF